MRNVRRKLAPSANDALVRQRHERGAWDRRELGVTAAPGDERHHARPVLQLAGELVAEIAGNSGICG